MTSQTFVLLSGALTFGVPLALAIRELLGLSTLAPDGDEPPREERTVPRPRPLPDCLLPAPIPAYARTRLRVMEDA